MPRLPQARDATAEPAASQDDPEPPERLLVEVVDDGGDWSAFGDIETAVALTAAAVAGTRRLAIERAEASVALSTDAHVAALNGAYRNKPKPTNVLSFPAARMPRVAPGAPRPLGDIILAVETVTREAADQGIAPIHHLQHLVVHGLLHLLGYDHETDDEADDMEALEREILGRLGIADPYADSAATVVER